MPLVPLMSLFSELIMPIRRPHLTQSEEREYLETLRRLQQEGFDIDVDDEFLCSPVEIFLAPPAETEVFERSTGGLRYFIPVRLRSRRSCTIEQVEIRVAFDHEIVLENPDRKYPIGMLGYPPVPFNDVLNARMEKGLRFTKAGVVVSGYLLATGLAPFPTSQHDGQLVAFTLSLYDVNGYEIVSHGQLAVRRAARIVSRKKRSSPPLTIGDPLTNDASFISAKTKEANILRFPGAETDELHT